MRGRSAACQAFSPERSAASTSRASSGGGPLGASSICFLRGTAIAILSGSTPRDIATLIAREDVVGLTRIKGIGKKTAELLVVELREKCELLVLSWNAEGGVRPVAASFGSGSGAGAVRGRAGSHLRHPLLGEVMAALVNMGWRPAEAEQAVSDLAVGDGASIETLLRQALRSMPR